MNAPESTETDAICPTCGPTKTEQHPRRSGVARCFNCKEWLRGAAENDAPRCEGLAPFRCGNPYCPAHGLGPETAESIIASLRARLDAVSDLADHLVGNEAAPRIREALNGYVPTRVTSPAGGDA